MSGMARTGLRIGDGHCSPSPCTELSESAWWVETHTASCPAKDEQMDLCPEVLGNSGRTKAGIGTTPATQRSTSALPNKSQIWATICRFNIPWASVSTESRLRGSRLPGREPLSMRETCPEPKGGDGVHACLGCATVNPLGKLYGILPPCCPSWQSHDTPWVRGNQWISAKKTALSSRQFKLCTPICPRRPCPSLSGMRPSWPFGDGELRPFWLHSG